MRLIEFCVMSRELKVLQVIGSLDARTGGPSCSIKSLAEHLHNHEIKTDIWTFNYPYKDRPVKLKNHSQHFIAPDFFLCRKLLSWNPWIKGSLAAIINKYDLIHNNGQWLMGNYYARLLAGRARKPLIISPRGMLEPWALGSKELKKKIAWRLYEKRNLDSAVAFHATSSAEAESLRRLGFRQPIAVISNGVELSSVAVDTKQKKTVLFLSRIDVKKGLERLISIWGRQMSSFPDWELVIAGDGDKRYMSQLKKSVQDKGMSGRVRWAGFVEDEMKKSLYKNASVFILPTFSENFGNAIAEALSSGIPVVTTKGTPWDDIQTERCGWYVENSEKAIETALAEALQTSAVSLAEMGNRGRQLIERKYSWPKIAGQMAQTYEWILKRRSSPPECVQFD